VATTPAPRGVVVIMHGLKDHTGHYAAFAARLAAAGYSVYAFDLRGHGRSAGPRVAPGRWTLYVDDLEQFLAWVEHRERGMKVFLFGHSMGGAIATLAALDHEPTLAGLILSAPALAVDAPPLLLAFTQLAGALLPGAKALDLPNHDFSSDPKVGKAMDADPLISQGPGPARTAAGLIDSMRRIWEHVDALRFPVLALHGTRDALTAPSGSRELIAAAPSSDKTLRIYDGLFHDLLHEPKHDVVEADIIAWLDAHTGGDPVTPVPVFPGTLRGEPVGWTQAVQLGAGISEGIGFTGTASIQLARPRPLGWHGGITAQLVGDYRAVALRPVGIALRGGGAVIGASAGGALITGAKFALSYAAWAELPLGPAHIGLLGERMRRVTNTHDHGPLGSDQLFTSLTIRYGGDRYYWPHARAGIGLAFSGGYAWRADEPSWFATIGLGLYGAD
jgi:alpha-beta hydrolase superfamily lysophospholipase